MESEAPPFRAEAPPGAVKPERDPAPAPSQRKPGVENTESEPAPKPVPKRTRTRQIAQALTEILQIPAVPAAMLGDEWAEQHFMTQGEALATQIAEVSERNELLRQWCERAMTGESVAVLAMGMISYAYPPLIHWGIAPPLGPLDAPRAGQPQGPLDGDDTNGRVSGAEHTAPTPSPNSLD